MFEISESNIFCQLCVAFQKYKFFVTMVVLAKGLAWKELDK
jgi:hypothetical protein